MFMSMGDLFPVGNNQTGFAFRLIFLASFVNLFLLGKFGTLVEKMERASSKHQMRLDQTNEILSYLMMSY